MSFAHDVNLFSSIPPEKVFQIESHLITKRYKIIAFGKYMPKTQLFSVLK